MLFAIKVTLTKLCTSQTLNGEEYKLKNNEKWRQIITFVFFYTS